METDELNLLYGIAMSIAGGSLLVYFNSPAIAAAHLSSAVLVGIGLPYMLSRTRLAGRWIPLISIVVASLALAVNQAMTGGELKTIFGFALTLGLLTLFQLRTGQPLLSTLRSDPPSIAETEA